MKTSKEIVLILFIGIAAIYLAYKATNLVAANPLSNEYSQVKTTYDSMSHNLMKLDDYKEEEKQLLSEVERLSMLKNIHQEDVVGILNDVMMNCSIDADKITFSEIKAVNLRERNNENENQSDDIDKAEQTNDAAEAQVMAVSMEFTSDFESILMFIDEIQTSHAEITVTNVSVFNSDEGDVVRCLINLNIYFLAF